MVDRISAALGGLSLSAIRRYTALAMEREDCVALTIGEPDMPTPRPILEAAAHALESGDTHYTANQGSAGLRAKIAAYEAETRRLDYKPDEIIITAGATEAIYCALTGILDPGDEVVIPTPAFGLYETVTRLAGAVPVYLDTSAAGFQLTYEALSAAITPKTKALVLNSPNNPTGAVYDEDSLAAVRRAIGDKPIFILCDDVYRGLCTEPCPDIAAFGGLRDRLLITQSFSKPWAMTGWRIGYLMGSAPVIKRLAALHAHILTCVPAMLQTACEAALKTDTAPMKEIYAKRRDLVLSRLCAMNLQCPVPEGAFYAFPNISGFGLSSEEFCLRMIAEAGAAAVPGSCFGTEGHIRISYCCGEEKLRLGMDRLEAFIYRLEKERRH